SRPRRGRARPSSTRSHRTTGRSASRAGPGSVGESRRPPRCVCRRSSSLVPPLVGPRRSARERLVLDPVRLVGVGAQPLVALFLVGLVVPLAPDDRALAFEGEDVGGDTVAQPSAVAHL